MKPPLLIVNPVSGSRREAQGVPRALARVEEVLGDVAIRFTSHRDHARELARRGVEEGFSLVIAVGGDGTFSEVANGVLEARGASTESGATTGTASGAPSGAGTGAAAIDSAPGGGAAFEAPDADCAPVSGAVFAAPVVVGIVNLGTGGDFRRSLGIGTGLDACLEALATGRERLVDVGRARFVDREGRTIERYFVNVLSAGLGGLVDRYIERMPAFLGGRAGYYLAALGAVVVSREQQVLARITWLDETREETIPAYLVAVCNGRWFGGGMDVAPMAAVDDGRLEVITITAPSKPYLADKVRGVYAGHHLDEPTVHHFPCRRITLQFDDERAARRFPLDVDGEALGTPPLEVEVLPRWLKVRA